MTLEQAVTNEVKSVQDNIKDWESELKDNPNDVYRAELNAKIETSVSFLNSLDRIMRNVD